MNRSKLKSYAPSAREAFRQAVRDRARKIGLDDRAPLPFEEKGDYVFINGQPFPRIVAKQRRMLEKRIAARGFNGVIEEVAYTWFNRFMAIRFMELHGYLDHGFRVLSHPEGKERPQILDEAENVALPGLDRERVIELKLDGTKDEELYKLLLLAQCRALHDAMPFLFELIDDETEALLPDNLLASDSPLRRMVTQIEEADWQEVEIIGWLYQFYISEKKDEVIGKVVKSEDIPAATQLFTPNWIVKYMVHNSLGRQWLATYPASPLRAQMEYYIEPAEQSDEVQAQLAAITPQSLDPETLSLLDPAAGSGHILVEAYEVFKQIYIERGYRLREIPRLILEKNLFGLDIDDRAAQMAGFALLMKARADDRRILDDALRLNVRALQNSDDVDAAAVVAALGLDAAPVAVLCDLFRDAKTFGSLITIPPEVAARLDEWQARLEAKRAAPDLLTRHAVETFEPLLQQAQLLARRYDAVVANPPYMGNKFLTPALKVFLKRHFDGYEKDLFSTFIVRCLRFAKQDGQLGFMSPFVWMFISSYEDLRRKLIDDAMITSLVQLEYSGFEGATVPICTFTIFNRHVRGMKGSFIKLSEFRGAENQAPKTLEAIRNPLCGYFYETAPDDLEKIPGSPIAYWASTHVRRIFQQGEPLKKFAEPKVGMNTTDNQQFLRRWHEVPVTKLGFGFGNSVDAANSTLKWFPYNKGGTYRKWYGNNDFVVNWQGNGKDIKACIAADPKKQAGGRINSSEYYFRPSITWSFISSAYFGVRQSDRGFIFDVAGSSAFPPRETLNVITGYLCSNVAFGFMQTLNPTLAFQVGNVASLPFLRDAVTSKQIEVESIVSRAIQNSRDDWNSFETSWDFARSPLIPPSQSTANGDATTVEASFATWERTCTQRRERLKVLEEGNNRLFIEAYGLQDELSPEVPDAQITLARANREADVRRLISYAVGCMMGRYSLDEPGLIYAHSGNEGFDAARYPSFPSDADGILPLTDTEWFPEDDLVNRFITFLRTVWPPDCYSQNLQWVAESLGPRAGEAPADTLRRYFVTEFYKNHLQTYKNRPIYWLFSSGKERAFGALVYLHRYNGSTLARMRMDYVVPLQGRLNTRLEQLPSDIAAASSTATRRVLEREQQKLNKQLAELLAFDEKLRHLADQRITLDLDDGVKVNYSKFGDLLADVKIVTGGKESA